MLNTRNVVPYVLSSFLRLRHCPAAGNPNIPGVHVVCHGDSVIYTLLALEQTDEPAPLLRRVEELEGENKF